MQMKRIAILIICGLLAGCGDNGPSNAEIAYSDEAGRVFRREAGQAFQFDAGHCSDLKPDAARCLWV